MLNLVGIPGEEDYGQPEVGAGRVQVAGVQIARQLDDGHQKQGAALLAKYKIQTFLELLLH